MGFGVVGLGIGVQGLECLGALYLFWGQGLGFRFTRETIP